MNKQVALSSKETDQIKVIFENMHDPNRDEFKKLNRIKGGDKESISKRIHEAYMACVENPLLMQGIVNYPRHFVNALADAIALNLTIGNGVAGQGYLIPYKGKIKFSISRRGITALYYRQGIVLQCALVYKGQKFEFDIANNTIHHPCTIDDVNRKNEDIVGGYCRGFQIEDNKPLNFIVLSIDKMNESRDYALSRLKDDWKVNASPWTQYPSEMYLKTVAAAYTKWVPLLINNPDEHSALDRSMYEEELPAVEEPEKPKGGIKIVSPNKKEVADDIVPAEMPSSKSPVPTMPDNNNQQQISEEDYDALSDIF